MANTKKAAQGKRTGHDPSEKTEHGPRSSKASISEAQPSTPNRKKQSGYTIPAMAANQAAFSFGNNVAPPFFSYYIIRLGGNAFHLGLMQAFQFLFTNGLQLPSAFLSDKMGKRIPFIIAGIGISALMFLLITRFQDLWIIIILICIQSAALSIYFPSWSALVGDELTCANRGTVLSEITEASIVAGLMGSVTSFLFLMMSPDKTASSFVLPFIAGAVSFLLAVIFIIAVKENPVPKVSKPLRFKDVDSNFLYLTKVQWAYNFFMALSWPLFPMTVAKVLNATNAQIAIITMIVIISSAAFQPIAGKMLDRAGPVPLIQTTRFVFVMVPFVYAFSTDIFIIYVWSIFEGLMSAFVNVAFISYILDSSPPETRAEYFAYYNMGLGMATFSGAFISGAAVVLLQNTTDWSLWYVLFTIYMVGGFGRLASSFLFIWLKNPMKFPSPPGQMAHAKMELVRWLRHRH